MAAQVQFTNIDATGGAIYATGFIVVSSTYVTGGDPLNFTGAGTLPATADPSFVGMVPQIISSNLLNLDAWSMGGVAVGANYVGYTTVCTKSGTPATINPQTGCKLMCCAVGAVATQHGATSYESQYTSDVIGFMAVFTKEL